MRSVHVPGARDTQVPEKLYWETDGNPHLISEDLARHWKKFISGAEVP